MKYSERRTIAVTSVDRKGRGRGETDGRESCVSFTVPGETVEAAFVGKRKGVRRFELEHVIEPSPHRVVPPCPHAGRCGGCAWQHVNYPHQLELKRGLVNDALARADIAERVESVEPCPSLFGYRNRMDFCVGPDGQVGLKEPGRWNAYVDLTECPLLGDATAEILREFREWMRSNGVRPWDARQYAGYARYLVIREGKNTGERMITVVTSDGDLPAREDLVRRLAPHCTTLYHGVNPEVTDLSVASRLTLLHGNEFLTEEVAGRKFLIPPNSFFQTNTAMAARLLSRVRDAVTESGARTALDLYCGAGFFSIGIADQVERVFGVELDEAAIVAARRNAELNRIANASFEAAKAESLIWERKQPDLVIVDPPRAGLHPKVVRTLAERRPPHLVYISCNYESFARDWVGLREHYQITSLAALDLFPHSAHVELVAEMVKRNA